MGVVYVSIAWLVGLGLAVHSNGVLWPWLLVAGISLFGILFIPRNPQVRLAFFALLAFSLGATRYIRALPELANPGHIAYFNNKGQLVLTGVVSSEPVIHDQTTDIRLRAEKIQLPGEEARGVMGTVFLRTNRYPELKYGDRLAVEGELVPPSDDLLTGWREYLAHQHIYSEINAQSTVVVEKNQGSWLYRAIYEMKDKARLTIRSILPDPQAALLTGILLGDDSGLPAALEEQFRITGMTHIIAISGFNIAILAGLLLAFGKPLLGHRRSAWFVMLGIAVYTVLVGADAAVLRAAIMASLLVISTRLLGRPTYAPASLFTAALVMTMVNPFILWDIGFQLSFAATLGLMIFVGPWGRWLQRQIKWLDDRQRLPWLRRMVSEVILATLAALLLTMPLIVYHFGRLSLISPLANLFILPAQPGVMIWGGLATLVGMVFPVLGQVLAWIAWLFLNYTISLVRFFSGLSAASIPVTISPLAVVTIYLVIFGLVWFRKPGTKLRALVENYLIQDLKPGIVLALVSAVAALVLGWAWTQPDGDLHITFFDVGQGDAILIETPAGRRILVDGGAFPTLLNDHLGRQIPFWNRKIDVVVATHPDGDHIAGLPGLFDHYDVDQIFTNGQLDGGETYQALLEIADKDGTVHHEVIAGEVIQLEDGVRLEVLNPGDWIGEAGESLDNNKSVAMRLVYGRFSLLLTGDAGWEAERALLTSGQDLTAVVYKAGHHGANSSSSAVFLERVKPAYIIVSAGEGNRYGHPGEEFLNRAANVGAAVLRTDELGTIEVVSDGHMLSWKSAG